MTGAVTLPRHMGSWGESLDFQRSSLRWDIKRTIKSLCSKLSDIGEECFLITVNPLNDWVSHMGSVRGDEYLEDKPDLPYNFLNYCKGTLVDSSTEHSYSSDDNLETSDDFQPSPTNQQRKRKRRKRSRTDSCSSTTLSAETFTLSSSPGEDDYDDDDYDYDGGSRGKKLVVSDILVNKRNLRKRKSPLSNRTDSINANPPLSDSEKVTQLSRFKFGHNSLEVGTYKLSPRRGQGKGLSKQTEGTRPFVCKVCCQTFKHKGIFLKHFKSSRHKTLSKWSISCRKCNKVFPHRFILECHIIKCKTVVTAATNDQQRKERRKGIPRKVKI